MKRIVCNLLFLCMTVVLWGQTPEQLVSFMTPVDGWAINKDLLEIFHEDNLYERINGASPGYIAYNFQEMTSIDYQKEKKYITIQVYRHATTNDAFGIYSAERAQDAEFLSIGAEGYQSGSILNFLAGCCYVKIQSPDTSPETAQAIAKIARNLAEKIEPDPEMPGAVTAFPPQNLKPHSEMYVSTKFLGHEFLHGAFSATYSTQDGKTYKLFIIDGKNRDEIKQMLTDWFAFTKQPADAIAEGKLTAADKYNGDVHMQWQGKYLWGIQNDWEVALDNDALLENVAQGLINQGMIQK